MVSLATARDVGILKHFHGMNLVALIAPATNQMCGFTHPCLFSFLKLNQSITSNVFYF